jgi:hypothetical protein
MKDKQKLQGRQLRPLSALEPACHWSARGEALAVFGSGRPHAKLLLRRMTCALIRPRCRPK